MSRCFKVILITAILAAFNKPAIAQRDLVTLELNHAPFDSFVVALEQQTPYRFFYDQKITDSLFISIKAERVALETVLDQLLLPHELFYAIDADHRIFITERFAILTKRVQKVVADSLAIADSLVAPSHLTDYVIREDSTYISIENRLFEVGSGSNPKPGPKTLSGYIKDINSGTPVSLASVSVLGHNIVVQADQSGYYSIILPEERSTIRVSSVGKKQTQRQLLMHSSGRLDIEMFDEVYTLKEVIVSAERGSNVRRTQLGVEKLSIAAIKQTPTIFGEADVIKVVLTLPGVQTVGEAASGFNVRGGATDQNLVLFSDATIYNPAHFFGFFSAFNSDVVNNAELYKGSIPARFGGRLSSVLDVSAREGNRNKIAGSGGIGLLTSRLSLEGPIGDKTSFLVGGRSTYSDWLLRLIPDEDYEHSSASFYDVNFNINHSPDDQNTVYLTGYFSNDRFSLDSTITYGYQNRNLNLKWKRIFNSKVYGVITGGFDGYRFNVSGESNPVEAYRLNYDIGQLFLKTDVNHQLSEKHDLTYGLHMIGYQLHPGTRSPIGSESIVNMQSLSTEQALESALYISDTYQVSDAFALDVGVRYSMFNFFGPGTVNQYAPGLPRSENSIIGVREYGSGDVIKTYHAPEIRLGARYSLSPNSSIKAGYNSLRQYIHMLSNTTAISPTDTWKLSDAHIRPQFGDQVSLGFYHNFNNDAIETAIETYYKRMDDYLDYKSGALLLMNETIETDVIGTEARAYGVEFLVKKLSGKLNGWASYTYSRVEQRTVDADPSEMINGGAYYPSNFDIPHNFTLIGNYKFSHRISFSLNLTYRTGRPITLPISRYHYAGSERVHYSNRNQYRIPDFFRTDASFNIEGNHKIKKLAHSSWSVGVYNVTGRRNPFSVYYESSGGQISGYRLSVFGHQIPFITYNFKF